MYGQYHCIFTLSATDFPLTMQRLEIAGPVLQGKLCTEEGDLEYQKVNLEIQTQIGKRRN